jgi:hypothetical protein
MTYVVGCPIGPLRARILSDRSGRRVARSCQSAAELSSSADGLQSNCVGKSLASRNILSVNGAGGLGIFGQVSLLEGAPRSATCSVRSERCHSKSNASLVDACSRAGRRPRQRRKAPWHSRTCEAELGLVS